MLDKGALDEDIIRFSQNMLGGESTPQVLFVRPCYTELLAQVLEIVDDPTKYYAAVVMGTPGTDKLVCCLYATHHLLNEKNATVLYSHGVGGPGKRRRQHVPEGTGRQQGAAGRAEQAISRTRADRHVGWTRGLRQAGGQEARGLLAQPEGAVLGRGLAQVRHQGRAPYVVPRSW